MKLSFKTLDQKTFSIDFDAQQTVLELKNTLAGMEEISIEANNLQLIYSGRILKNEDVVSTYAIEEGKFLVIMSKRSIINMPKKNEANQEKPTSTKTMNINNTKINDVTPSVVPDEVQVATLMNMGYKESNVRTALRLSFNQPERAIEYLKNGIPTHLRSSNSYDSRSISAQTSTLMSPEAVAVAAASLPPPPPPPPPSTPTSRTSQNFGVRNSQVFLNEFANNPHYDHIRNALRSSPQLLTMLLQRLQESNPQQYQSIVEHLRETSQAASLTTTSSDNFDQSVTSIELNEQERNAVARLCALGFQHNRALEAYLACDKNEELAADYLFRHMEDED